MKNFLYSIKSKAINYTNKMRTEDRASYDTPLPLVSFSRVRNVGDMASFEITEYVSGREVFKVSQSNHLHLCGLGSILSSASEQSYIWGSGFMGPEFRMPVLNPRMVHALRGKLTADSITKSGLKLPTKLGFGDPGFLIDEFPHISALKKQRNINYALGFVPHYVDYAHPFVKTLSKRDDIKILDVRKNLTAFVSELLSCEVVASSSLHGLVFSEALGVPNLWLSLSDAVRGEGFKFRDWFSLAGTPTKQAYQLTSGTTVSEITARARLHDMKIDKKHLMECFPKKPFCWQNHKNIYPSIHFATARKKPMPVFLISFNRGDMLKAVIEGYRRQTMDVEIVIHDNGSDDTATMAILDELAQQGVKVYRGNKIHSPDELNNVHNTIDSYFSSWAEPQRYAVSDCDIDISDAPENMLEVFDKLLDCFPRVDCVGPMLKIDDIPEKYPLRSHVLNRHIEQFWKHDPQIVDLDHRRKIAVQFAKIDTTLAVHRASMPFKRMRDGIRVYPPYEARHLDWYITAHSNDVYMRSSNETISHWRNEKQFKRNMLTHPKLRLIKTVRSINEYGPIEIIERNIL